MHVEGPGAGTQSDDHGSSAWSSTPVAIGSSTTGNLEVSGDRDYFQIEIPFRAKYVFYTYGASSKTIGVLYNERYEYIAGGQFAKGDLDNLRIEKELAPGTYYLEVKGRVGVWSTYTGEYALHVEGPGAGTRSDDHGSSPWSSTPVAIGTTVLGRLEVSGDRDFFCINIAQSGDYSFYTTGQSSETIGTLYDSYYKTISSTTYAGVGNFSISRELAPGIYYLEVKGWGNYAGEYALHLEGADGEIAEGCGESGTINTDDNAGEAEQPENDAPGYSPPQSEAPTDPQPLGREVTEPSPPARGENAVVLAHGWRSSAEAWIKGYMETLCGALNPGGSNLVDGGKVLADQYGRMYCQGAQWDIWYVDWRTRAGNGKRLPSLLPWQAVTNARAVGTAVGAKLGNKGYRHIHFLGHSAGSMV